MPTHVQFVEGGGFYPAAVCAFMPGYDLSTRAGHFTPKIYVHGPFGTHEVVVINQHFGAHGDAVKWAETHIRNTITPA